ncbi:unnamed protein product, partial [Rotaria magnacalcarata]
MKEYLKALPFYEESVNILVKFLPHNYPLLATPYGNLALVLHAL